VETKSDGSPVTIADLKAEDAMRELVMRFYPDHGILGEEHGNHNPDAEYTWVLDPLDGTNSFICGVELFGTLIAVVKNGIPIFGVIHLPILDKLLSGDNQQALLGHKSVRIRNCPTLASAVLLTTDHLNIAKFHNKESFEELTRQVKIYRTWGDCYGYYLLATGYADIMVDPIVSPWDASAIIPIIRGAGGTITDYRGGDPMHGNSLIAAANNLHPQVLSLLNS
jgi:histidinol phosphatase-like enzyme (inositol monophosphatase family)